MGGRNIPSKAGYQKKRQREVDHIPGAYRRKVTMPEKERELTAEEEQRGVLVGAQAQHKAAAAGQAGVDLRVPGAD